MADTLPEVRHNKEQRRYEMEVEGLTSVADYRLQGDKILFTHTGVPRELEGRGIAGKIVKFALDDARAQNLRVVPLCSYVVSYIKRHPEYQDLLAEGN